VSQRQARVPLLFDPGDDVSAFFDCLRAIPAFAGGRDAFERLYELFGHDHDFWSRFRKGEPSQVFHSLFELWVFGLLYSSELGPVRLTAPAQPDFELVALAGYCEASICWPGEATRANDVAWSDLLVRDLRSRSTLSDSPVFYGAEARGCDRLTAEEFDSVAKRLEALFAARGAEEALELGFASGATIVFRAGGERRSRDGSAIISPYAGPAVWEGRIAHQVKLKLADKQGKARKHKRTPLVLAIGAFDFSPWERVRAEIDEFFSSDEGLIDGVVLLGVFPLFFLQTSSPLHVPRPNAVISHLELVDEVTIPRQIG